MIFASTDNNKEVLENYPELWNEIKNQIETINGGEPVECEKHFMKIRFESDNVLLVNVLSIPSMIVVVGSVFQEDKTYYPQVHLHECLHILVQHA